MPVRLHEDGRAEVLVGVPPIAAARQLTVGAMSQPPTADHRSTARIHVRTEDSPIDRSQRYRIVRCGTAVPREVPRVRGRY